MLSKKNLYLNEKTLLAVGAPAFRGAKNRFSRRFCLFLAFCLLLLPLSVAQAQMIEEWVARYDGPVNSDDWASALAVDGSGNVYVTGYSYGSETERDYATIKYDNNGNELWVAQYDGPGNSDDYASALAVDDSGNVYVTGKSYNGTDYDYATIKYDTDGNELWVTRYDGFVKGDDIPLGGDDSASALAVDGSGNVYVTGESNSGTDYDYATIKYDTDGNELWVARYDGPVNSDDYASALAVGDSGNVYVTGKSYNGTDYDYATIKYDDNGNELWVARYDGPVNGDDSASALAVDDSGNVYVTGDSEGSGTSFDYATIKYDDNGNELWVARYDGPVNGDDSASALAVDDSGNVYVTGDSEGSGTSFDYATIKYDDNGNELWVARYDGPVNGDERASALAVGGLGNVYVTGYSWSGTERDYATIKYAPDGNELWVARYDGPGNDWDIASALAVDGSGNVYVTGYSWSGTSLDYATIKYGQQTTLVCKTDKPIYNPWERVQVLADVDNPGGGFDANLLGGIIVIRIPPQKPLIRTGQVVTQTIAPGLNPDIPLFLSRPGITGVVAPEGTHGAFCILYTSNSILAIDTSTWGLTMTPGIAQDEFFLELIRIYIDEHGLENLMNTNADVWAFPK